MRIFLLWLGSLIFQTSTSAQSVSDYLEKIRNDRSLLSAFFSQMPKGGDLHHHYSGSVYAETYFEIAVEKNYFVNTGTLEISKTSKTPLKDWTTFSALKQKGLLGEYKQKLLQLWSVFDYNNISYPSHKQFFETFGHFDVVSDISYSIGLPELKKRAVNENVSYLETIYRIINCDKPIQDLFVLDKRLHRMQVDKDLVLTENLFDSLFYVLQKRKISECAIAFNKELTTLHQSLSIDDTSFTMRYQNFVLRFMNPVQLFANLITAFESSNMNPLVVGVNIVAPEHGDVSMNDYWLHMQMFRFCHKKFPGVKYAMHAGELAPGLVKPEELSWHISSAVYDAGANRIGHGVDIAYEKHNYELLKFMQVNDIPVEINLFSNEFILKVKDDQHPIRLYNSFNVPVVISSDDAGVLRSSLTEQFVLLAFRYPDISYNDIKKYVYNSIRYSFIKENNLKEQLIAKLDRDFILFEKMISKIGER